MSARGEGMYTSPPTVDRMIDACENITFPQLLLRTVIKTVRNFSIKFAFLFKTEFRRKNRLLNSGEEKYTRRVILKHLTNC